jgi:hypothetical protein
MTTKPNNQASSLDNYSEIMGKSPTVNQKFLLSRNLSVPQGFIGTCQGIPMCASDCDSNPKCSGFAYNPKSSKCTLITTPLTKSTSYISNNNIENLFIKK